MESTSILTQPICAATNNFVRNFVPEPFADVSPQLRSIFKITLQRENGRDSYLHKSLNLIVVFILGDIAVEMTEDVPGEEDSKVVIK